MPRYTCSFLVFSDESEMAGEFQAANAAAAETAAIAYFDGTLSGLTKSALTIDEARDKIAEETLAPEDGDYAVSTKRFGQAAQQSAPAE